MKKVISKITAAALALCLSCVGFAMPKKVSAAAAQPVQLYYAQEICFDGIHTNLGQVSIQNLGYQKQVTIHYTVDGKNWTDAPATYVKADPSNPGYEVWSFDIYTSGDRINQFAIKYQVNGNTYWDNNSGKNYNFSDNVVVLGKDVVKLASGDDYDGIYVQNLGVEKKVGVRYTLDNWATYKDVDATYQYSTASNSMDVFDIPSFPSGAKYAVYYTVNGVTYWDNNFGDNYSM